MRWNSNIYVTEVPKQEAKEWSFKSILRNNNWSGSKFVKEFHTKIYHNPTSEN